MCVLATVLCLSEDGSAAQQPDSAQADSDGALRVYIDCGSCDFEYIRTEITFVAYVRDRHNAQVHVLITRQATGSGGREYTLAFLGQQQFLGKDDTLTLATRQFDTDETIRNEIVRVLKLGLMRYAASTPAAKQITISYQKGEAAATVVDPWDYWVFRVGMNVYLNGEKSRSSVSLNGNISANRTTADLKIGLSMYGNYNANTFEVDEGTISSFSRSKGFESSVVFALGDHWSAGAVAGASSSTYQNRRSRVTAGAALEYNVFPYSESTRRVLRIDLNPTYNYDVYEEQTIYDRKREHLVSNKVEMTLELKQVWGSVRVGIEGSHYFHDFSKNRLELYGETSLHIVEGLSVNLYGNISMVHDQLSLPASSASTEEILLRRRELATQYDYFTSIGLSYSFGSIYSSVVNPRFGSF